jgi:hypothetical protein
MHRVQAACSGRTAAEQACVEIQRLRDGLRQASDRAVRSGDDDTVRSLRLSYIALRELIARIDEETRTHVCDADGDRSLARQSEALTRSAQLMTPTTEE